MRKIFGTFVLGAALCAGLSSPLLGQADVQGQHEHRGPLTPEQELGNLTKALQLSSEQQGKLKPVLEERHAQLMHMQEDKGLSREQKMAHMKQVDEGANAKVLGILNGEQKTKYQAMIEQRRERREAMQRGHGDMGKSQE